MKQTNPTENLYAWWVDTLNHSVRVVSLKIDGGAPQVWVGVHQAVLQGAA
jgi:hypothetical protein